MCRVVSRCRPFTSFVIVTSAQSAKSSLAEVGDNQNARDNASDVSSPGVSRSIKFSKNILSLLHCVPLL